MTKPAKVLFTLTLLFGAFTISVLPASAWYTRLRPGQSPTHFLLAQLSSTALIQSNLYNQEAVYKGSNEPDDHGLQDHTASARRSYQSFKVAAQKCAQGDRYWAARRLARSFHYLQDCGDPTDYLRGGRKGHVRQMAHAMLIRGRYAIDNAIWQSAYNHFRSEVSGMNPQATLGYANRAARDIGGKINNIYAQWYQRGRRNDEIRARDRAVHNQLLAAFGLLAACQDRTVELFVKRCQELAAGLQIQPEPRRDYESQAAPRPSAR